MVGVDAVRQRGGIAQHGSVKRAGGFRGEREENPVHLARNFRRLAGFSEEEITELVDIAATAFQEAQSQQASRAELATQG